MKLTQKYTVIQLIEPLADGTEWEMGDWPLHVTLADVFSVDGNSKDILRALETLKLTKPVSSQVVGEDWFGPKQNIKVKLLDKSPEFTDLHTQIIKALKSLNVRFNNPEYVLSGFKPHSTVQAEKGLKNNDVVEFNALTLIDMFPDENAYRRRIVHTLKLC